MKYNAGHLGYPVSVRPLALHVCHKGREVPKLLHRWSKDHNTSFIMIVVWFGHFSLRSLDNEWAWPGVARE